MCVRARGVVCVYGWGWGDKVRPLCIAVLDLDLACVLSKCNMVAKVQYDVMPLGRSPSSQAVVVSDG